MPTPCARPSPNSPQEVGGKTPEEIADGFIQIAVENMANAIKKISVQRGYDVTRYALNCFGGAGGQHACLVADALGMTKVLIHPFSSLLSAYGMGLADIRATRQQAIEEPLGDDALGAIETIGERLGEDGEARSRGPGRAGGRHRVIARAHIRYAGTDTALVVECRPHCPPMHARLREGAQSAFGFIDRNKQLVVEAVRVEAIGGGAKFSRAGARRHLGHAARARPARTRFYSAAPGTTPPSLSATQLAPGHIVKGPAIIIEPHQTIVVEAGWQAEITAKNHLVLTRVVPLKREPPSARTPIRSCWRCSTTCSCRSPSRWA